MAKFSVGDRVILLGDTNDDANNVGWCSEMDDMIDKVYTIKQVIDPGRFRGLVTYKLEGDPRHYQYDEEWLGGTEDYKESKIGRAHV